MDTNEKIKIVGTNIQEKANLIWNVANSLFGAYKPHEYGLVILPMVVIKRFHDCLLPTREKVLATYEKVKQLAVKDGFLRTASGYRPIMLSIFWRIWASLRKSSVWRMREFYIKLSATLLLTMQI